MLRNTYGFPLPSVDMAMASYGPKEHRLRQGKRLYNQFKKSDACPADITKDEAAKVEKESYDKRIVTLRVKDMDARSKFQYRFNQEWKRLHLPKNARLETVTKFQQKSKLWAEMSQATITRDDMIQMITGVR